MTSETPRMQQYDVNSHLANERTHLAYLRTGISLISFGVTLNRFSLFLIQNKDMERFHGRSLLHDTENVGIGMVILGCAMLVWSVIHFMQISKTIDSKTYIPSRWPILAFTFAVIVIGTASTVWMMIG